MPESILVVEDEPSLQETLAYNLKKDGYGVETVGDGLSALEAARRIKPDLIITADIGSERPETCEFEPIFDDWLESEGFSRSIQVRPI